MRKTFIETLLALAEVDPDIWLLNADLGFSFLEPFAERFPSRYLNVGVAEQNMIGVATGLALSGAKVFAYSIANFPTLRCLEQIRNDVCCHRAHVVVVAVGAGFAYGLQGYTHHAIEDLAVMRALPGIRVGVPADRHEAKALVAHFARQPGPAYLRLGRDGEPAFHAGPLLESPERPLVVREGRDVAILVTGTILEEAAGAAELVADLGLSPRIVSIPMLKPLDEAGLMASINGCSLVVTVEEHSLVGGLRDTVAPILAQMRRPPRLLACGVADGVTLGVTYGQKAMRRYCGIDRGAIADRIRGARPL